MALRRGEGVVGSTLVARNDCIKTAFSCISLHVRKRRLVLCFVLRALFYKALNGGEGGIRTHGWFPIFGFQDHSRSLCLKAWKMMVAQR